MSHVSESVRMPRCDRRSAPRGATDTHRQSDVGPPWRGLALNVVREAAASRVRALGHVDRLRIVEVLSRRSATVGEIAAALGVSVSAASRHLRVLHVAQVADRTQDGNFAVYTLADKDAARLVAVAYAGASTQIRRLVVLAADSATDLRADIR
jgi:DNA-binding transcriptional ArsR family regulator